ncbi:glutathione S-transferase family protein [Devosia sp.]|uniref:glutathione S-transferase family protein n=1 Tax=Devosia sp. TaxID=1871048 RepID=UPI0032654304
MQLYYTHNLQPRVCVAMARYLNSPVEFIRADPMGVDKEAMRAINPNTLAPILVENHRSLWETDAVVCRLARLANSDIWPMDELEELIRWLSWSAHHLTLAGGTIYFWNIVAPQFTTERPDPKVMDEALDNYRQFARILDDTLATRTWLVGDKLSYADFRVATTLPFAEKARMPVEGLENLRKWHDRLMQIDAWRDPFNGLD